MKEGRYKILHAVWFHLYKSVENSNYSVGTESQSTSVCLEMRKAKKKEKGGLQGAGTWRWICSVSWLWDGQQLHFKVRPEKLRAGVVDWRERHGWEWTLKEKQGQDTNKML